MDRKKIVYQLDTPYSSVQWPHIDQEHQDTILELLCGLITPIGQYRENFITPSRGKRDKKRKRTANKGDATANEDQPPKPDITSCIDVGLANISRVLQTASSSTLPTPAPKGSQPTGTPAQEQQDKPYSVVFVARSGQSSAFHSHFPQMVAAASRAHPGDEPIRLVGFSRSCEERLSSSLGIPRVSCVALRCEAPQANGLVDYVKKHVAPVEIAWLSEARRGKHLETKIVAVPTSIGVPRKQPKKAPV